MKGRLSHRWCSALTSTTTQKLGETVRTKLIKRVAVVATLALALAACGGDDGGGATPTSPADAGGDTGTDDGPDDDATEEDVPDPEPTVGGVLRYVQTSEPATMNPVRSVIGDAAIWGTMFDRLIAVNDDMSLSEEGLIVGWEAVDDTTWVMTLREGVTFHNGEPWNADALVFTLDEYRLSDDSIMKGFLSGITDVVAIDETTVEISNAAPNAALPTLMSTLYALPPGHYSEVGGDEFQQAPLGTGPFVFSSYSPGVGIEVVANDDYWRGRPALDGLQFSWAPDEATRAALLESGDADVVDALSVRSANRLRDGGEFEVVTVESLNGLPLFLVDSKPPLDDPVIREIIVRSIDRQALVDTVFEGVGATATTGILSPISPFVADPDDLYDPDLARELLASLDDVPAIPFSFQVGRQQGDGDVGEVVAGMMEAVGLTVDRNPQEYAVLVGAAIAGEVNGMFNTSTRPVYMHPDVFANAFLSPTVSLTKSCLSDPRLDELRIAAASEFDPEAAGELYAEMDRLATGEVFCIVPLYVENRNYGMTDAVQGFTSRSDTVPDWYGVSLAG